MARIRKFLFEADEKIGNGITFVDIDETLFDTFAKVNVIKNGKIINSLTNTAYNEYQKGDGESFDYSEFRDSKLFHDTSVPRYKMINRIIHIIKRAEKKGSKVVLLTAREDFNDKELFLDTFRKYGFPVDKTYIERSGNLMSKGSASSVTAAKKMVVLNYLKTGIYRRARIFDDYIENCSMFLSFKNSLSADIIKKIRITNDIPDDVPDSDVIQFEAFHVQKDGSLRKLK